MLRSLKGSLSSCQLVAQGQGCRPFSALSLLRRLQDWSPSARASLLGRLASLLHQRSCTDLVAQLCLPLLTELLAYSDQRPYQRGAHQCLTLGQLVARYPTAALFVDVCLEQSDLPRLLGEAQPGEEGAGGEPPPAKRPRGGGGAPPPLHAVRCCWQLLRERPGHLARRWDWSPVLRFLRHSSPAVAWYAVQCMTLLLSLDEPGQRALLQQLLPPEQILLTDLRLSTEVALGTLRPPVWPPTSSSPGRHLAISDLGPDVTCVAGLLLPQRPATGKAQDSTQVSVTDQQETRRMREIPEPRLSGGLQCWCGRFKECVHSNLLIVLADLAPSLHVMVCLVEHQG